MTRKPHAVAAISFRQGSVSCTCSWAVTQEGTPEQVKLAYDEHRRSVGVTLTRAWEPNRREVPAGRGLSVWR